MSPDSPESRILALERQAAEAAAERRMLDRQLATFGPLATQILEAVNDLRHLTEDFHELRQRNSEDHRNLDQRIEACAHAVGRLDNAVRDLREDYDEDADKRAREHQDLVVARRNLNVVLIGGIFTLLAALIASTVPGLIG